MELRIRTAASVAAAFALALASPAAPAVAFPGAPALAAKKPRHCVVDLSAAGRTPVCHTSLHTAVVRADVVIYVGWDDPDYEGSSITFTAPRACTDALNDIDYAVPSLPRDWTIGSYRTFANCWAKHYELPNFGGRSTPWGGPLDFDARSFQLS